MFPAGSRDSFALHPRSDRMRSPCVSGDDERADGQSVEKACWKRPCLARGPAALWSLEKVARRRNPLREKRASAGAVDRLTPAVFLREDGQQTAIGVVHRCDRVWIGRGYKKNVVSRSDRARSRQLVLQCSVLLRARSSVWDTAFREFEPRSNSLWIVIFS